MPVLALFGSVFCSSQKHVSTWPLKNTIQRYVWIESDYRLSLVDGYMACLQHLEAGPRPELHRGGLLRGRQMCAAGEGRGFGVAGGEGEGLEETLRMMVQWKP